MNNKLTRRGLLGAAAGAGLAACSGPDALSGKSSAAIKTGTFSHGIASGDPFQNSVVLWTHITSDSDGDIDVGWKVFTDEDLTTQVASGTVTTNKARDYCVKAIPDTLKPGQDYFFQFTAGDAASPIGRTRTLPEGKHKKTSLCCRVLRELAAWIFQYL